MADAPNLPKGIPIPAWFRRYLEATATGTGEAASTPAPAPLPIGGGPQTHRLRTISLVCARSSLA